MKKLSILIFLSQIVMNTNYYGRDNERKNPSITLNSEEFNRISGRWYCLDAKCKYITKVFSKRYDKEHITNETLFDFNIVKYSFNKKTIYFSTSLALLMEPVSIDYKNGIYSIRLIQKLKQSNDLLLKIKYVSDEKSEVLNDYYGTLLPIIKELQKNTGFPSSSYN